MMEEGSAGRLFVYGSLMFPAVWEAVVGGEEKRAVPAVALGFHAFRVEGEDYPGLVPVEAESRGGARTKGLLLFGIGEEDWERLDAFEGAFYKRVEIGVTAGEEDGDPKDYRAQVYQVRAEFRGKLTEEVWDNEVFAATGLGRFLERYVR